MKKILLLGLGLLSSISITYAQRTCGTMQHYHNRQAQDPQFSNRMQRLENFTQQYVASQPRQKSSKTLNVIRIPVVVHVVYNTSSENISTAQINSQIRILNEDFRLTNADSLPSGHAFWPYSADTEIEFCLATKDPSGNSTTGITRTQTSVTEFADNTMNDVKFTANGGHDNWDPTKYLNIWVCNLGGGLLGFATFPADLSAEPAFDGVVVGYKYFGDVGPVVSPNDGGRTATHEVGHWLNLRHIWGDDACATDYCNDTPTAEDANYGCKTFPHKANNNCGTGSNGEMYMNYMDYVDDACMNMFTFDQKSRMRAALNADRSDLLSSLGCGASVDVSGLLDEKDFNLYPNPSNGTFRLTNEFTNRISLNVSVVDVLGNTIIEKEFIPNLPHTFNYQLPAGVYFMKIEENGKALHKKIVVQ